MPFYITRATLLKYMVGKQGFEPWTSTASGWRSPPELLAYMQFLPEESLAINVFRVKLKYSIH